MTSVKTLKVLSIIIILIFLATLLPKCETSSNYFLKIHKEKVERISGNEEDWAINIEGDKYYLITHDIYQEYYSIIESAPQDLLSSEYYMLNASTNEKMYPHKNMYVLTKEGLKKTDKIPEFNLGSNAVRYNNTIYYLLEMPVEESLTNCMVYNIDNDVAEKGSSGINTTYTYLARFDKPNNRFIIDSSAAYLLSNFNKNYQTILKEQSNSLGSKRRDYRHYIIDHTKNFDCELQFP